MFHKMKWIPFTVIFIAFCFGCVLFASLDEYDKYLSASEIENVTGLNGVRKIPRPEKGPAGELNFARQDGKLLLIVRFYKGSYFDQQKADEDMFGSEIQGVGDGAFSGPSYAENKYFLFFRKGEQCVMLSTFLASMDGSSTMMSIEHLTDLAKIVAGRM